MQISDFPGLYQAADELSGSAQKHFLAALLTNLALLVAAAVVSVINYPHWGAAALQAALLAGALASSVYLATQRPERLWYSGRAVAESIKTMVWRYVSRAEPFHESDEAAKKHLLAKLTQVVEQNPGVSNKLLTHLPAQQITHKMKQIRAGDFETRRDTYIEFRINDQLGWYSRKANFNAQAAKYFFIALISVNAIAFGCALIKIANVEYQYFPTDVLIAVAASILAWMQAKRFTELSASYALTAHEITLIREQADELKKDEHLSTFVGDAENAFSREHTQWEARKDN
ncbi:DUF4231 domain-containing protein [Pseudomonas sp. CDFA 602]|uniref:DUF4231 domain-containing protein n=1 Tax=Pseudomonas californiensis TaxID=2829823 RepID=UPI001E4BC13D|nr:DUF4231 domain-containing protein [Pseudomonas californiensis]MCD5995732.1 DUF4231 domain-containing protein [Pseudomonas californiensis]MCD6001326.1 DUF4231 domain-containing protein [Pseudomonas californiensis]